MSNPHFLDGWATGSWPTYWDRPTLERLTKCQHARTILGNAFERDNESAYQVLEACLEAKWKWKKLPSVTPKAAGHESDRAAMLCDQLAQHFVDHEACLLGHNRLLSALTVVFSSPHEKSHQNQTMSHALRDYGRRLRTNSRWDGDPELLGKPGRHTAFRTLVVSELILALERSGGSMTNQQLADLASVVVNDPDCSTMPSADDVRKTRDSMKRNGTLP